MGVYRFKSEFYFVLEVECAGGSWNDTHNCCTSEKPCKLNQGDCDHDGECEGNLVCGNNNCGDGFSWNAADCCMKAGQSF